MTIDSLAQWQPAILYILNFCLFLFVLWLRSKFVTRDEHDKAQLAQDEKIQKHNDRLITIESALKHLPTAEQVNDLSLQISSIEGDMKTTLEKFNSINQLVDRLEVQQNRFEQFLLQAAR